MLGCANVRRGRAGPSILMSASRDQDCAPEIHPILVSRVISLRRCTALQELRLRSTCAIARLAREETPAATGNAILLQPRLHLRDCGERNRVLECRSRSHPCCTQSGLALCGSVCCAQSQNCCNNQCSDPSSDNLNCGACGVVCPSGTCSSGKCVPGGQCAAPYQLCDSDCVDTQHSPQNCGGCGAACPQGQGCENGMCTDQCPPGYALCPWGCIPSQSDPNNCGICGRVCKNSSCIEGNCVCNPGYTDCSGECADLLTDTSNCGECGHPCYGGSGCIAAKCVCDTGETPCPYLDGDLCTNLNNDTENCGSCGNNCVDSLRITGNGNCECKEGGCSCPYTMCNGQCTNTSTDNSNCGGCGNPPCPEGTNCVAGTCTCPIAGWIICNGVCVDSYNTPRLRRVRNRVCLMRLAAPQILDLWENG